jgi:hypothetical protein
MGLLLPPTQTRSKLVFRNVVYAYHVYKQTADSVLAVHCTRNVRNTCRIVFKTLCLTYLLTYSMEQSPSWEANWFAASQEIPRGLWNPKGPHRTHKRPPPVRILSQPSPVLTPTSHFLKIHPNIILPSTPGSPQRSLSLRFPDQNPVHNSPFPQTCYMPRPSHSSRFYHPHDIGYGVQTIQLLIM